MKVKWIVPWIITEFSGKYYLFCDQLEPEPQSNGTGTTIVLVERINSRIICHIHPDEISEIDRHTQKHYRDAIVRWGLCQVILQLDKSMPTFAQNFHLNEFPEST